MVTKEKIQQVAELEDRLKRAVITIGLDYRGLTVAQMRDLRLALRAQEPSMELRVVKNTLLKRAAENCGHAPAADLAVQSTALLLGYEEEINPPKALSKFLRDKRLEITIHGGYLDGALLSPSDVITLATTPSRRELMGLLAGGLSSPLVGIAMVLQDVFRGDRCRNRSAREAARREQRCRRAARGIAGRRRPGRRRRLGRRRRPGCNRVTHADDVQRRATPGEEAQDDQD